MGEVGERERLERGSAKAKAGALDNFARPAKLRRAGPCLPASIELLICLNSMLFGVRVMPD
jgi:hypothetical protein